MRIRHGLTLDEPNDFDLVTQDAILARLGPDHRGHPARAGRHLVDRPDGRRHRRDGHHDDLGHRAHARDRRPQGPRRPAPRDPVCSSCIEAVVLTSRRRSARHRCWAAPSACCVHLVSGFPVSLPWWSFALGLGFSASIGIFFGMFPAGAPRGSTRSRRSGTSSALKALKVDGSWVSAAICQVPDCPEPSCSLAEPCSDPRTSGI